MRVTRVRCGPWPYGPSYGRGVNVLGLKGWMNMLKTHTNHNQPSTLEMLAFILAAAGVIVTWIAVSSVGDLSRLAPVGFYLTLVSVACVVIGRDTRDRWTLAVRLFVGGVLVATGAWTVLSVALCGLGALILAECQG
jgi:hypothetical protein